MTCMNPAKAPASRRFWAVDAGALRWMVGAVNERLRIVGSTRPEDGA
jgi:hypothetical protein